MTDPGPTANDEAPEAELAEPARRPRRALTPEEREVRRQQDRDRLLADCFAGRERTIEQRVAIVLNHHPDTRDSDIKLQLQVWRLFEGWGGGPIDPAELFTRARLTSLARARARIQNQLGLFLASPAVRQHRGMLEEDERAEAADAPVRADGLSVFADETGKTERNLIVGGIWFGNPPEAFALQQAFVRWRVETGFESELHFSAINDANEAMYREGMALAIGIAPSLSFKALRHQRAGIRDVDDALDQLFYHMLVTGVRHEHETHRSPLPRELQFWKDREEVSRDRLRLAALKDRVAQAGQTLFDGRLQVGEFDSVDSATFDVMQVADLFVGALGRTINTPSAQPRAKDRFAAYLLELVGMADGPDEGPVVGDVAIAPRL